MQRRNQKIVEETPSVFVTPELRKDMGEKAVAAAKAVNYIGAGTIEFLVDKHRNYYFLEMNTRLQVEHPITEEVIGVDLVKEQIKVADGQVLQLKQENIQQRGHAIECRICAEDTEMNFMPSPGIIKQITEPNSIGVRIDSYVYEGYEIPIYYDPMIGIHQRIDGGHRKDGSNEAGIETGMEGSVVGPPCMGKGWKGRLEGWIRIWTGPLKICGWHRSVFW